MAFTEKYVTTVGAGSHDGSSEANAWTFEEAIAAPVATGCRVNVKTGTHTLTAARTLPSGTSENPIEWRGYNSTIGDLESVGRDGTTGELLTTNFPIIDCTAAYRLTMGGYCTLKNLIITSAITSNTTLSAATAGFLVERCRVEATGTGSTKCATGSTVAGAFVDCDFPISSNNSAAVNVQMNWNSIYGCRVWCTSGSPNASQIGIQLNGIGAECSHCVIFNVGKAITISASSLSIRFNSWFGVATGIEITAGAGIIEHNVGWSHSGYAITGSATSGNPLIRNNALGSHTSGRLDTTTLGSVIEEKNAVTLTADPFVDSTNKNFSLNNTSGGGILCRAASRLWNGYADLGAIQSQATAGGGSGVHLGGLGQTAIGVF